MAIYLRHHRYIFAIALIAVYFISLVQLSAKNYRSAIPFLLYTPSAVQSGMGETGTALPLTNDPYNFACNPAQLGLSSMSNNFMAAYTPASLNHIDYAELPYNSFAFQAGFNLKKIFHGLPVFIGIGYMEQETNMDKYLSKTINPGNGKLTGSQWANSFSIGFGLDYFVKVSAGLTYKTVSSRISMDGGLPGGPDSHAFDFGILASVPVIDTLALSDNLTFDASASAGYALVNLGPEMDYGREKDPLPRSSNIGYGLAAGLNFRSGSFDIRLLDIRWTSEANESLVRLNNVSYDYSSPFTDVNFIDNIFLLKPGNSYVDNRFGLSLSAFETISASYGQESEAKYVAILDMDNQPGYTYKLVKSVIRYKTYGYSLHTKGAFKYLSKYSTARVLSFILNHCDMQLSHSKIDTRSSSNLLTGYGSNYWQLGLLIYGL